MEAQKRVIRVGDCYRSHDPRVTNLLTARALVKNDEGGERIECTTSKGKRTLVDPFRLSKNVSRGYERVGAGSGEVIWSR